MNFRIPVVQRDEFPERLFNNDANSLAWFSRE